MSESDVERMLRSALVPIAPPDSLTDRLETSLTELTGAAADELAEWELSAMRDPRNWVRPVGAAAVVGVAGAGLVLVRARQQHRRKQAVGLRALEESVRDVTDEVMKRLSR